MYCHIYTYTNIYNDDIKIETTNNIHDSHKQFQARHFIARLDTDRYRECKLYCLNSSKSGGTIPNTIQKAFDA